MPDTSWQRVCGINEIPDGTATKVTIGDSEILLVRRGDQVHACGNSCPHYGGPMNEGTLRDDTVICPYHHAAFRYENGELVTPPALDDLPVYEVKVVNGEVSIGRKHEPRIRMPSGSDSRSFLIVGAGAAGSAAAESLRRRGFAGRITMVTAERDLPYDRPMLSKGFVSGQAEEGWLSLRSEDFYRNIQVSLRLGAHVAHFDPASRSATLASGERITGDAVLLATGGTPRTLPLPGADVPRVYTLRSAEDARRIKSQVQDARRAVILGAGFIGMEMASDLTGAKMVVHVVAPEAEPMSAQFGERIGRRLRMLHEQRGVSFHMKSTAKAIEGSGGARSVLLSDGTALQADIVILAFGVRPEIDFLSSTDIVADGAVPVDETLMTSRGGVFAAGDIAVVPYPGQLGRHRIEHWVVAQMQGRHAAASMLGEKSAYSEIPFFWTRQAETSFKYLGFPGDGKRIAYRGNPDEGPFLAGYYREDRLVGVATLGMSREMIALEPVIRGEESLPYAGFSQG